MVSSDKGYEGEDEGQDRSECRDGLFEQTGMSVKSARIRRSDMNVP